MKKYIIYAMLFVCFLPACGKKTAETKPIRKDVTETVFASGVLEADGAYNLTAQSDGYLVEVNFEENDVVPVGKVLAVIDNKQSQLNTSSSAVLYEIARSNAQANAPSLMQARNNMAVAKQKKELDSVQVLRYEKLLRANSIAKTEFENVSLQYQTSQTNYQNAWENYKQLKQQAEQTLVVNESQKDVNSVVSSFNQIRAITACKIYQKLKQKGDFVRKGDAIARIGDATFVYAKVNVDEGNIEKIKIGQEATIQLNTNKSKLYKGKVAEISPTFNEASQSFMCKIVFAETLDFKIVQTQLQTNIKVGELKNALLIPRNYLGYGDIVQVKGKEKPVKVTPRIISSEWVQVESGIDENNTIITDNL